MDRKNKKLSSALSNWQMSVSCNNRVLAKMNYFEIKLNAYDIHLSLSELPRQRNTRRLVDAAVGGIGGSWHFRYGKPKRVHFCHAGSMVLINKKKTGLENSRGLPDPPPMAWSCCAYSFALSERSQPLFVPPWAPLLFALPIHSFCRRPHV